MVGNLPANAGDTGDMILIPMSERALEEEMATHFTVLAWEIPWTEEPDGQQSMGLQRVKHDLVAKQQQLYCVSVLSLKSF